MRDAVIERP